MLSLSSLAGWEDAVLASLQGASGTLEERDHQIERSGMFGEYPAILHAYIDLFGDEESALEAVKRAMFLEWRGAMAPSALTGIASLPEGTARAVIGELDARARRGGADDELAWMLAWYAGEGRFLFELYGATTALLDLADSMPADAWRTRQITSARMKQRGQLGRYWMALATGSF